MRFRSGAGLCAMAPGCYAARHNAHSSFKGAPRMARIKVENPIVDIDGDH